MKTINVGDLVYYDGFLSGLIKCKLLGYRSGEAVLKVTATQHAYRRSETLLARPNDVIPRDSVYTRNHKLCIRGTWRLEGLADEHQPKWASAT